MPLSSALEAEIAAEFRGFTIRPKRGSTLHRAIDVALRVVTLGGQRRYLTGYHTVLFGTLWVCEAWEAMSDEARYVLLRHERVHLRQRRRLGDVRMALYYLLVFFPVGLAWGRARIEWEAYEETILATYERFGRVRAEALMPWLVERFTGPDYGWMWPFPRTIRRWFAEALERAATACDRERAATTPGVTERPSPDKVAPP